MTDQVRNDVLTGATYKVRMEDGDHMYITVNEQGGVPFEVFIRFDRAELHEWIAALTILITRLLRAGQDLPAIAAELQEIHSPASGHMIPGSPDWCPSLVARVGMVLMDHKPCAALRGAA